MTTVTVLMPVHNAARFLPLAIESILSQSFSEFEVLLINDGSTDRSGDLIDAYAARDNRVRAVHQKNIGLIATLNKGLQLANGEYIARMDSDDISRPKRLEQQLKYLQSHRTVAVIGGAVVLIDANGRQFSSEIYPLGPKNVARAMASRTAIAHPAAMYRKDVVLQLGGYKEFYKHAEDRDLWLRVLEKWEIDNLPDVVIAYRKHAHQVSAVNSIAQCIASEAAAEAHRLRSSGKIVAFEALTLTPGTLSILNLEPEREAALRLRIISVGCSNGADAGLLAKQAQWLMENIQASGSRGTAAMIAASGAMACLQRLRPLLAVKLMLLATQLDRHFFVKRLHSYFKRR